MGVGKMNRQGQWRRSKTARRAKDAVKRFQAKVRQAFEKPLEASSTPEQPKEGKTT